MLYHLQYLSDADISKLWKNILIRLIWIMFIPILTNIIGLYVLKTLNNINLLGVVYLISCTISGLSLFYLINRLGIIFFLSAGGLNAFVYMVSFSWLNPMYKDNSLCFFITNILGIFAVIALLNYSLFFQYCYYRLKNKSVEN